MTSQALRPDRVKHAAEQGKQGVKKSLGFYILLHWQAIGKASGKCHFIGILQFASKSNTTGYSCNPAIEVLQFLLNIINGGIALYIWA